MPRLLPERAGPVQHWAPDPIRGPVPGQRDVHGRLAVHRHLPGIEGESAAKEAGSLKQHDVVAALDYARIPQGPGAAVKMVPGQHMCA